MICAEVIGIDIEKQTVKTEQTEYPYDELLIATGSYAVSPPIEGINHKIKVIKRIPFDYRSFYHWVTCHAKHVSSTSRAWVT